MRKRASDRDPESPAPSGPLCPPCSLWLTLAQATTRECGDGGHRIETQSLKCLDSSGPTGKRRKRLERRQPHACVGVPRGMNETCDGAVACVLSDGHNGPAAHVGLTLAKTLRQERLGHRRRNRPKGVEDEQANRRLVLSVH